MGFRLMMLLGLLLAVMLSGCKDPQPKCAESEEPDARAASAIMVLPPLELRTNQDTFDVLSRVERWKLSIDGEEVANECEGAFEWIGHFPEELRFEVHAENLNQILAEGREITITVENCVEEDRQLSEVYEFSNLTVHAVLADSSESCGLGYIAGQLSQWNQPAIRSWYVNLELEEMIALPFGFRS